MSDYHLYIHTPAPVFRARVVLAGAVTYPIVELAYDTVTLGAYTDILPGMTLLLGTTEGGDNLGRVRVKAGTDSDSIALPRTARGIEDGTLDIRNDAFITVLKEWRVWAKIPYFDLGEEENPGNDYKDGDIAAGTYNTNIPPVANTGPAMAGYADAVTGLLTVTFPDTGTDRSYAMADGATLSTYAWDVDDGTITVGTSADPVITATFPAGFRYVSLTVTDSNGQSHTAYCPVLAINPANDLTLNGFSITQRLEEKGQTLDLQRYFPLSRETYPDGALVLFWWGEPASAGDRSHMKFVGWLDREGYGVGRKRSGITRTTTLHAVDVAGRLAVLPAFPQALEREENDSPWSWMPSLDINKSLYYLLQWHSTALDVADFYLPTDGATYDAMRLDNTGTTLFGQVDSQAQKMVPDHYLTCNSKGQLRVTRDWMLDDVGDRPTTAPILTEALWTDLSLDYNRHPKVHSLRSGAILSSTDWVVVDGEDTLPLAFSIAPGEAAAFSQGTIEATENEGLALSQADLNTCEGHRYALLNSRYGEFTFSDPTGSGFWDYEPALFARVQLNVGASYQAYRELDETQFVGRVKTITVQYKTGKTGTSLSVQATFQREESGAPALTYNPDTGEVTPVPYTPEPEGDTTETPGIRTGVETVAAILSGSLAGGYALYRTADFQTPSGSGGPTWEAVSLADITDTTLFTFVVDPFSPGYRGTGTAVNGWVVGESAIWRIEDMFGAASATEVHTFPVALPASQGWRTIQASFGRYQETESDNPWLICVSHYRDTADHTGTWATRSVDGGATWSAETLVSSYYDTGSVADNRPMGLYLSPKTPGLAYTAAYTESTSPSPAGGYQSTDWGETWSLLSEAPLGDDPPLPDWGVVEITDGYHSTLRSAARQWNAHISISGDASDSVSWRVCLAPPANAKRVVVQGHFDISLANASPGLASASSSATYESNKPASISEVTDFVDQTISAAKNETDGASGTFTITFTKNNLEADWPGNRDQWQASLPNPVYANYCYFRLSISATTNQVGESIPTSDSDISHYAYVSEIELDDGTIYAPPLADAVIAPGNRLAGDIHVPWPTNDDESVIYHGRTDLDTALTYRLYRTGEGTIDISPLAGGRSYGLIHYGFGLRTYDNDRDYVAAGLAGNGAGTNPANTLHGAWVSEDGGDSWTQVISPIAASNFVRDHGFSLAFAADDPLVLFVWGPARASTTGLIQYSSDLGATLDNREGDMGDGESGTWALIGIAGGPLT